MRLVKTIRDLEREGDFCYISAPRYALYGKLKEDPNRFLLTMIFPLAEAHKLYKRQSIPVVRCRARDGNWEWDGNENKPTVSPIIRIYAPDEFGGNITVWQGFVESGVMRHLWSPAADAHVD